MKTWNDYKNHIAVVDDNAYMDIEEMELVANIITSIIEKRNEKGITQRELAAMSGLPQSSIARIESGKTIPKIDTLFKLLTPLGLNLKVTELQQTI